VTPGTSSTLRCTSLCMVRVERVSPQSVAATFCANLCPGAESNGRAMRVLVPGFYVFYTNIFSMFCPLWVGETELSGMRMVRPATRWLMPCQMRRAAPYIRGTTCACAHTSWCACSGLLPGDAHLRVASVVAAVLPDQGARSQGQLALASYTHTAQAAAHPWRRRPCALAARSHIQTTRRTPRRRCLG
jgi:hypothetical protein